VVSVSEDELDLVETDRLIEAIKRRFDCIIIGTVENLGNAGEARGMAWRGGFTTALGLLSFLDKKFAAMLRAETEEEEDG
jgi:hypothetical protein